ncbi:hypothetical protein K2173_015611 [Erythroxylum novogranatense]|uniref:Reverse transcriptase zinc-binding domain-containing protein n=1 Tax=Erythroxylum novogranatense TaxID=1862640 RepID=A0AAV8TG50_9ROSI|nr:hypothetical protein K2173_015611 [Erythroxylum novogranatense]
MLKSVLLTLPNYVMHLFLLPKTLCMDIQRMMCRFWWGHGTPPGRGIHWMSWERMCQPKFFGGLGFKHLHDFNLSMVGKQAWQLFKDPTSVVARVLKAKYFPSTSFLASNLGNNPSFIWRSFWESKSLLKEGACLRVRSGSSISIWEDCWLPSTASMKITTARPVDTNLLLVSDLIANHRWKSDVILQVFDPLDVAAILSMPLSRSGGDDDWFWRFDNKCLFTVHSAYRRLRFIQPPPHLQAQVSMWRKLWSLRVSPKCLNFVWRALNAAIPCVTLLQRRNLQVAGLCPFCQYCEEDELHVLVYCDFARACWLSTAVGFPFGQCVRFRNWFASMLNVLHGADLQTLVVTLWAIWEARNALLWTAKRMIPLQVARRALNFLHSWLQANESPTPSVVSSTPARWSKPAHDHLKLNVDGALFDNLFVGLGIVVRDSLGSFISAMQVAIPGHFAANTVEVMAIREALSWIKDVGWSPTILESDAQSCVRAILDPNYMDESAFGLLVFDCKSLLTEVRDVSLVFIRRSANGIAHRLARAVIILTDKVVWSHRPPMCIYDSIRLESL